MTFSWRHLAICLCASIALGGFCRPALGEDSSNCKLTQLASLDAVVKDGRLLIPAKLDDRPSYLRVDTAAPIGIIDPNLVKELKLQEGPLPEHMVVSGSGHEYRKFVMVHRLQLGNMIARDVRFVVAGDANPNGLGYDATFDANFLTHYDVELDLAHGKLNLFSQDHCKGQVVYWSDIATSAPIYIGKSLHTIMPVTVNGQQLQALLNTCAWDSKLSLEAAKRLFGGTPNEEKTQTAGPVEVGTGQMPRYSHRLESLKIGGVEFRNTEVELVPDHSSSVGFDETGSHISEHGGDLHDVVIGLRHLEKLRIYIAYGEGKMYITPADAH